jgi:hypothetical protein
MNEPKELGIGSKVMSMNIYFVLPDNFSGTYEDAILEYLKYRREKQLGPNYKSWGPQKDQDQSMNWQYFINAVKEGFRCSGGVAICQWDGKEWKSIVEVK